MIQFLLIVIVVLALAAGVFFLIMRKCAGNAKKYRDLYEDSQEDIKDLEGQVDKHLVYIGKLEELRRHSEFHDKTIREAENDVQVQNAFDDAVADLSKLRNLRKEREERRKARS